MSPDEKWVLLASNKKKVTPCKISRLFSLCHRCFNWNVWLRSKEMFGNQTLLDCLLSLVTFSIFPRLSRDACDFTIKGSVQCCDWLLLGYFSRASDNQSVTPNGLLLGYVASRSRQPWHSGHACFEFAGFRKQKIHTLWQFPRKRSVWRNPD